MIRPVRAGRGVLLLLIGLLPIELATHGALAQAQSQPPAAPAPADGCRVVADYQDAAVGEFPRRLAASRRGRPVDIPGRGRVGYPVRTRDRRGHGLPDGAGIFLGRGPRAGPDLALETSGLSPELRRARSGAERQPARRLRGVREDPGPRPSRQVRVEPRGPGRHDPADRPRPGHRAPLRLSRPTRSGSPRPSTCGGTTSACTARLPGRSRGIAVLTDSDQTRSRAVGDYGAFRVCPERPQ